MASFLIAFGAAVTILLMMCDARGFAEALFFLNRRTPSDKYAALVAVILFTCFVSAVASLIS